MTKCLHVFRSPFHAKYIQDSNDGNTHRHKYNFLQTYLNSTKEIFLNVRKNSKKCRVVARNSSSGMGLQFNKGIQVVQFLTLEIKYFQ